MAEKLARYQEIYRRGLQDKLPPEKKARADELIKRGVLKVDIGFPAELPTAPEEQTEKTQKDFAGRDPRSLKALGRGTVSGLSFGFSDEFVGGAKALGGKGARAIEKKIYGDTLIPETSYKKERDIYREETEKLREEYPKQMLTGEIVGSIGSPIGGLVQKGVGAVIKGGGKIAKIARVATTGGAEGAVYGAGYTEDLGDVPQTLQDIKEGTLWGAGLGLGFAGATKAGKLALKPLAPAFSRVLPKRVAKKELVSSLKKEGVTPQKARESLQKMQDEGIPLIDVIDQRSSNISRIPEKVFEKKPIDIIDNYVKDLNIAGNKAKKEVLDLVSKKKISSTEGAEILGQNAQEVINRQKKLRSTKAKPLYEKAFEKGDNILPADDEILQRPVVRDAIEKAKAESGKFGVETVGTLRRNVLDAIRGKSDLTKENLLDIKTAYTQAEKELSKIKKPKSLLQYIKEKGGIYDEEGELATFGITNKNYPTLIRKDEGGRTFDDIAFKTWEEGYFPDSPTRPTVNEFLEAVEGETRGWKRFTSSSIEDNLRREELSTYLDDIIQELDMRDIDIERVKKIKGVSETEAYADNSLQVLHQAKDYLYRKSKDFTDLESARYGQVYNELSEKLKKASPEYRQATKIWAGETKGIEELYKQKGIGNIAKKYERQDMDGIRSSFKNVFKKTVSDEEIARLKNTLPPEDFGAIVRKDLENVIDESGDRGASLTTSLFGKGEAERSLANKRLDLVFSPEQKRGLKKTAEIIDRIAKREKEIEKIKFKSGKQRLDYVYGGKYGVINSILKLGNMISESPREREAFTKFLFTPQGAEILQSISKAPSRQAEQTIARIVPAILTQTQQEREQ